MRRENIGRRYDLQGRIKIEFLLDNIQTDPLQREEGRVSFVHVEHVRLDPERGERFHSSNTEHDFLTHAHLEVAAVKLRSDQSVFGAVFRNIAVEEIDVHPAYAQFPQPGKDFAIQNRHGNQNFGIPVAYLTNRQVIEILIKVDRLLKAVFVDLLPEIAMAIEETNRNKIQVKIAGRFAVVAGQDAEAAGVIRD